MVSTGTAGDGLRVQLEYLQETEPTRMGRRQSRNGIPKAYRLGIGHVRNGEQATYSRTGGLAILIFDEAYQGTELKFRSYEIL